MTIGFFTKQTASSVWKTVTGVSAAGAKRGRGRGASKKLVINFNLGQKIGYGQKRLSLPGLNGPLFNLGSKDRLAKIEETGEDTEYRKHISELRAQQAAIKKTRDLPLERGWNGRKVHGKKIGPPSDYNETAFENFQSTVLMLRPILTMQRLGRVRRMHALVVTGNGNGLAGFNLCLSKDGKGALRQARNKAGQSLVYVPRFEDRTVLHDFFSRYYFTTVFVEKKPEGYGIKAHRVVKAICEAFGIKDIDVRIMGAKSNQVNITKAFFLGLMNQKRYQDMANEKGLHLVEQSDEYYYFPKVLASPEGRVRTDEEIKATNESTDFTYYINEGKIRQAPAVNKHRYGGKAWDKHLSRMDYFKNNAKTKLMLAAHYGDRKVLDVFPAFKSNADSFKASD